MCRFWVRGYGSGTGDAATMGPVGQVIVHGHGRAVYGGERGLALPRGAKRHFCGQGFLGMEVADVAARARNGHMQGWATATAAVTAAGRTGSQWPASVGTKLQRDRSTQGRRLNGPPPHKLVRALPREEVEVRYGEAISPANDDPPFDKHLASKL